MEFDPVDAVAEPVVRLQLGQMPVGEARQLLDFFVARDRPEGVATVGRPWGFARDGGAQHRVTRESVEAGRGLRLVQHGVCAVAVGFRLGRGGWAGVAHADLRESGRKACPEVRPAATAKAGMLRRLPHLASGRAAVE
jgi:hypothetical protein